MASTGVAVGANHTPVILASASAARAALLRASGLTFAIEPANLDENELKQRCRVLQLESTQAARMLARAKAEAVSSRRSSAVVIGADQILDVDGRWFDKPLDRAGARDALMALRGRPHRLVSAVAVAQHGQTLWTESDVATLTMRSFSDQFLQGYLDAAGDEVCRSVGAYRVEGLGIQLFSRIEGDFFTILGIPLLPLLDYLRQMEVLRT